MLLLDGLVTKKGYIQKYLSAPAIKFVYWLKDVIFKISLSSI